MANDTMRKFGYPDTLIHEYEHWVVLLRPAQVTLGSLVLAAKSDATAFGMLPPEAHAELSRVTRDIEASLRNAVKYERINYLMLMMVDPHVHFHVFPRYDGSRDAEGIELVDQGWPGPPDLKSAVPMESPELSRLNIWLSNRWLTLN
ncbi:MAG: HIT family protein [Sphingomonas sp.]|nr:HIT family protein [Sphingomonas sp.]